jgi:arabinose-5-phosphate isomerase
MKSSVLHIDFDTIAIANRVIEREVEGLQSLLKVLDDNFNQAIDLIINTNGKIIVSGIGKSGHVARKIAATLSSTGTSAFFVHPSEAAHGDLGMIKENDAVILLSNSGETEELNPIIDYCKRFEIKTIGIARNANSTLLNSCSIPIALPNIPEASNIDAPTTSTTMMMALGDIIATIIHEKKDFSKVDFKVFHPGGKIGAKLLKVKDIMHTNDDMPLILDSLLASDAIITMTSKRMGCVGVINESGEFIGIFTDGDLRRHINSNFSTITIREIMTSNPTTFNEEQFASEVLAIMNKKSITNGFVLKDRKPIGIIHLHDILKAKVA